MKSKNKREKLKILAAGDIHGDAIIAKKLAERAKREKVDLVILTGDIIGIGRTKNIIKPFIERQQKVIFIPGNWETKQDADNFAKEYNIKNLDNKYVVYKDVGIFGVGSADWSPYLYENETFERLKANFDKTKSLDKKIIVSHVHAAGTKSELSGIPGNESLRKAIHQLKPDIFLHSHIHEFEGIEEKIGKTKVINVGKKGRIIEI